jgi:hypothetical protein
VSSLSQDQIAAPVSPVPTERTMVLL